MCSVEKAPCMQVEVMGTEKSDPAKREPASAAQAAKKSRSRYTARPWRELRKAFPKHPE